MANYHLTVKMRSRSHGKSCVEALAYCTATQLHDMIIGETFDYRNKAFVNHVEILTPEDAPEWIREIAEECKISKQSATQKLSYIFEAAEKRKDSQVFREVEFSLPNELTDEQNIKWANEFIKEVCVKKGMVAINSFHMDIDKETGQYKPHCHALLSTRNLTNDGLSIHKNLDWAHEELVHELREQCAVYQNQALKDHGFDARVSHLSYKDRDIDIEGQPKLGRAIWDMAQRGLKLDKLANFDAVKLRNQFKILKNPEIVFSIVTSNHSTFTRHDIARVLNRYIDDADQFRILQDRLLGSNKIIHINEKDGNEPVYTTKEMLRIELALVKRAETLAAQTTHRVDSSLVEKVIAEQNTNLAKYGGLSSDQDGAIRHMLKGDQLSCVIGYAGSGKTTSLEAARGVWEASGYKVLGLAPTGKAARNIEGSGIRSMTIHKFFLSQKRGREQLSEKSVVVLDEAGMVDSRRFAELLAIIDKAGAKLVAMGDGNQLQAIEAGPALRLLLDRIEPAVLETIVRQHEDWQREATRLFGSEQACKALALYQERGAIKIIEDQGPAFAKDELVDKYCMARQMSGRVYKEMIADLEKIHGKLDYDETIAKMVSEHQDFDLYKRWKGKREEFAKGILAHFGSQKATLEERGIDIKQFEMLAKAYKTAEVWDKPPILEEAEKILRIMSYEYTCDTRVDTKQVLVNAWAKHRSEKPEESHLMLTFTNKDALGLNMTARDLMRKQGVITGKEFTFETHSKEKDDFDREIINKEERTFAQGDRLLFTYNDNRLNVKNGTLGTITSISNSKIVVSIDNQPGVEVSFSPKLYPYIDHGWATNIPKSQGISVVHVKKLASFEEYRNLAYVGMTRHSKTLEVYGSSLDFWREEKIVDRLSRVQEKLSGFDYLDSSKINDLIIEDAKILWFEEKIQKGKDLWGAIKGTTKSAVDQLLDRPVDSITVDPLHTFEHSEEKRSTSLFKEKTDDHTHQQENILSPTVDRDSNSSDDFEDRPKTTQNTRSGVREAAMKNKIASRPTSNAPAPTVDIDSNSLNDFEGRTKAPQDITNNAPSPNDSKESRPQGDFENRLKSAIDKINDAHELKTVTREKFLSYEEVDKQLKERVFELATSILGKPLRNSGRDYLEFKSPHGKVSVAIRGAKQGVYNNFKTGVKGGPLKLIEEQIGLSSAKDSLKWASEWLGGNALVIEQRIVEKQQKEVKLSTWTPIVPVPKELENPSIVNDRYLNYMLKDGNKEVSRHAYRDEAGNLKGYVFRIEISDGSKITPPLAYCENEKGLEAWKWQAFEKENKTPYGIEKLAQHPTKPILVVEGEKTCDAAQKLLPEYNVLTWSGGAGNIGKTKWSCLVGKEVIMWPDNDSGGLKAANTLQKIVASVNAEKGLEGSVGIVSLPQDLPEKWDLADNLPERWTIDTVRTMIKDSGAIKAKGAIHDKIDAKTDTNIQNAVNHFIDLSVRYENMSWDDPNDSKTFRKIEVVAGKYINNEEFRHKIESCGNEVVIERFQTEMEEQEHLLTQDNHTSGVSKEVALSPDDISGHKAAANIEKAANEFIDLCVLYENMSWDDPNDSRTLRKIEAVVGKYMNNEEFKQRIEASKNEVAINRLQS